MNTLAAGDTWGVPGPTFLIIFIGALIAVAVAAAVHRRAVAAGGRNARMDQLGPQQLAYLNGGDKLAIYSSLGGLRTAGAIATGPDKTLHQSGPMPDGMTPLDTAVYNAAGRRVRARDVKSDQWVVKALEQLRTGLEQAGLAVSAQRRRAARSWALAGVALILLGVVRAIAGVNNQKPVGLLIPAIAVAALVTLTLAGKVAIPTRAASGGMAAVRTTFSYLAPDQSPAYATYGATGAAMGVALFGAASLYTMDPAFAAEAGVQRMSSGMDSSGSSCSSGSSSCSSGSSCGGGGGCGG